MSDKVIRDGKVAVLVSPGYGAGWSTWNRAEHADCMFWPEVVAWVEGGKVGDCPIRVKDGADDYFCNLGAEQLRIEWVPVGCQFKIAEYDGAESIELRNVDNDWVTA